MRRLFIAIASLFALMAVSPAFAMTQAVYAPQTEDLAMASQASALVLSPRIEACNTSGAEQTPYCVLKRALIEEDDAIPVLRSRQVFAVQARIGADASAHLRGRLRPPQILTR